MSYYRTETGATTSISTYSPSRSIGTGQVLFSNDLPIKYQEVIRLVSQYSGKRSDWLDDKFILTGIKNILNGRG
jgi:lipopolysaccharide/colanic/teichoic acid biosynthesis glycosyltransferase